MTLLQFAADRRAAVDIGRKATTPAADAPCSNRSISPAPGPTAANPPHAAAAAQDGTNRQTDGHRIATYASSVDKSEKTSISHDASR